MSPEKRNRLIRSARSAERNPSEEPRFARFEPVTVRAAARLYRLANRGRLKSGELRFLLEELLRIDRFTQADRPGQLPRLARRLAPGGFRTPAARRKDQANPVGLRLAA